MNPPPRAPCRDNEEARIFTTTHWSVVLAAGQEDSPQKSEALEHLCRRYWRPVYIFIRSRGADAHDAEDLTQAFFARLLEKDALTKVDRQKGKFRTFLMASVSNFLANEWDKKGALKRGGPQALVALEEITTEEGFLEAQSPSLPPDKLFDRRWAEMMVQRTLERIKKEYCATDKERLFQMLEPGLTAKVTPELARRWATDLAMSGGAVRVALHRLRRRFGELLRSEIAYTVSSSEEIDEEIRHLFSILSP
jgi:RNA polymerase sigma factor (sigma-70 family)